MYAVYGGKTAWHVAWYARGETMPKIPPPQAAVWDFLKILISGRTYPVGQEDGLNKLDILGGRAGWLRCCLCLPDSVSLTYSPKGKRRRLTLACLPCSHWGLDARLYSQQRPGLPLLIMLVDLFLDLAAYPPHSNLSLQKH